MAYANKFTLSLRQMKICLPTNSNLGLQSELASNFSAAHWLFVVESESQEILSIDLSDDEQRKKPLVFDIIICPGMQLDLHQTLTAQKIPIYGTRSKSVAGALADFWEDNLYALENFSCCKGGQTVCDDAHVGGVSSCQESSVG